MLERAKAEQRRARKARYRARVCQHRIVPQGFDLGEEVLGLLLRTGWLSDRDADDRKAIGRALKTMLEDAAKR